MAAVPVSVFGAGLSLFTGARAAVVEAAAIGDSIVGNAQTGTPNFAHGMRGAWHWANFRMGAPLRFRLGTQQGVSGETASQILSRIGNITSLVPRPRFCFVSAGNNDINSAVAPATAAADIESIVNALNAAGIVAVIGPVFPRDSWSAGQLADMATLNASIAAMAAPGRMIFPDYRGDIIDGGTGYTLPNVLFDGIHPGNRGAWIMSDAFVDALDPVVNTRARLAQGTDPGNKMTNGLLAGSTAPGGAWTGSIATPGFSNYSLGSPTGGTRTASKVARADAVGEWQQFALAGTTFAGAWGGGFVQTITPSAVGMTEGQVYELVSEWEVDGSTTNAHGPGIQIIYNDGATSTQHNIAYFTGAADNSIVPYSGTTTLTLLAPPFTMRADNGADSIIIRFSLGGQGDMAGGITATARVGRIALRQIG
jgi:lysophospholipase L1-like esterase